ncbi:MAG TPA: PilZ domain-containing protein [Candidatus Acidoferrales bacterium]|nr:PilZ domain-containing protein [Candidatus Acidoferrales bacterium]
MPATLITGKERVRLRLLLEACGADAAGRSFEHRGATVEIHREGALVEFPSAAGSIEPGQKLALRRRQGNDGWLEAQARVLGLVDRQDNSRLYSVELAAEDGEFWGIEFPVRAGSAQSVACMLLECCFCRRREVVYVTDRDMLSFNTQKGVARQCEACEMPTIWVQTLDEDLPQPAAGASFQRIGQPAQIHDRQATPRFRTRLTACVRAAGSELELAVCENMSRGGLCFRTRRRFSENDILEVAVPYTKGAANIFVPARVIYVQEVPTAGLHRHGAAYLRAGSGEDPQSAD